MCIYLLTPNWKPHRLFLQRYRENLSDSRFTRAKLTKSFIKCALHSTTVLALGLSCGIYKWTAPAGKQTRHRTPCHTPCRMPRARVKKKPSDLNVHFYLIVYIPLHIPQRHRHTLVNINVEKLTGVEDSWPMQKSTVRNERASKRSFRDCNYFAFLAFY